MALGRMARVVYAIVRASVHLELCRSAGASIDAIIDATDDGPSDERSGHQTAS